MTESLITTLRALREKLDPYFRHDSNCEAEPHDYMGSLGPTGKPCACGLDAALAELDTVLAQATEPHEALAVVERELDRIDKVSYIVDVREKFNKPSPVLASVVDRSDVMSALLIVRHALRGASVVSRDSEWPEQIPRIERLRRLIDKHPKEAQQFPITRSFAEEIYRELEALSVVSRSGPQEIPYMSVPLLADGRDLNDEFVLVHKRFIDPTAVVSSPESATRERIERLEREVRRESVAWGKSDYVYGENLAAKWADELADISGSKAEPESRFRWDGKKQAIVPNKRAVVSPSERAQEVEHRCGVRGFAESGDECPGCVASGRFSAPTRRERGETPMTSSGDHK